MDKRVAVILSGCGFLDGAEVQESVLTLLHLSRAGAIVSCFAPDTQQLKVVDHVTGDEASEKRRVLVEAARIARGAVEPLSKLNVDDFDAVIFPGGFGAALNLCDFALKGAECVVDEQAQRVLAAFYGQKKPIGVICIAPALLARVLGPHGVEVTIGTDEAIAEQVKKTGAKHVSKAVTEIAVDTQHRIVSTPAYMFEAHIAEVDQGISKLVASVLEMA